MRNFFFILGITLLVSACTKPSSQHGSTAQNPQVQVVQTENIELSVPSELILRPSADERRIADNDNNNNDLDLPNEYRVMIEFAQPSCSPSLTGVSKPTEIPGTNGKTMWGKADISENSREEGWEYEEWKDIVCTYEGTPRPTSVYSMCSEKSGKTVVICINQMTDDEPLAKKIFETFRWTK